MTTIDCENYVCGRARPKIFQKWWLRCKTFELDNDPRFLQATTIYVPWWAWPLELIHRMIFGYPKIKKAEEIN